MYKRLTNLERTSLVASFAIISCVACSGTNSSESGSGGASAIGGAATGGGTNSNSQSTGGASSAGATTGGAPTAGGAPTGGAQPTGGAAAQGGANPTGGAAPTGGTLATGGSSATGGKSATGGANPSGGFGETGGKAPTGGASTGGVSSATGGKSTTGGSSSATGGSSFATGGKSATGGSSSATGGAGSNSCPTTVLPAGSTTKTITSGGESRSFVLHIPTGYTGSTAVPAIIDFHPLGGTGSGQETSSGWRAKCDSVGCIAVFPNSSGTKATDNSWNAGYCCTNAQKNQVNDVQFARDIITWLKANTCLDAKRVYASGGSNGGGMTYRMACEASDVIAAVAPVDFRCVTGTDPLGSATSVTASNNTACKCPNLNRPITVVAWDEQADTTIVPYAGGQTPSLATDCPPSGNCVGIGFTSAQVNAQTWANFSSCTGTAATDADNSLCKTWSTCGSSTTVSLCTTTSGGHLAVYSSSTAHWTDMAWNKLKTQSLP